MEGFENFQDLKKIKLSKTESKQKAALDLVHTRRQKNTFL